MEKRAGQGAKKVRKVRKKKITGISISNEKRQASQRKRISQK